MSQGGRRHVGGHLSRSFAIVSVRIKWGVEWGSVCRPETYHCISIIVKIFTWWILLCMVLWEEFELWRQKGLYCNQGLNVNLYLWKWLTSFRAFVPIC
jgi:hypothetical protein